MSHHDDEKIQMAFSYNDSNTAHHRHSHLNPIAAIDHIKSKVKRKRNSVKSSTELPDNLVHNNTRRTSHNGHELFETKNTLTATRSHPISASQPLSDHYSDTNHVKEIKEENDQSLQNDENDIAVFDPIDKKEPVPSQINETELDHDNNRRSSQAKNKLNKESKTPPESNTKKRRPTLRRMGFHIRDDDFNSIFSELPSDEQLMIAYPCIWRKDFFMHGRIFLSVNYLCFYTCFFKREESLCIAYKNISSVTREKSSKLLPNAIKVRTNNREQYVFASYAPRERLYIAIFRLWQNALLEKPLDYQQLRPIVYADQISLDESTGGSEESAGLENNDERTRGFSFSSQSFAPIPAKISKEPSPELKPSDRKMVSPSADKNQTAIYVSACPCETHLARTLVDRLFYFDVDTLFLLTYGNNSFTRAFHESQKLIDYTSSEWRMNNETGKRERQVTYRTVTQSILGSNTISCTEKQVLDTEKPHSLYVITSEVHNEGMKYTDAFFVATRFCMFQRDVKHSSLRITAEIKYIKSVNAIAKAFIDKNANSSIEDGVNNQMRRLESHQASISNNKSSHKHKSTYKQHTHKHGRADSMLDDQKNSSTIDSNSSYQKNGLFNENTITGKGFLFNIALFIGISLLLLHIYLCYKLYSIDQVLNAPDVACLNQCRHGHLKNKHHY